MRTKPAAADAHDGDSHCARASVVAAKATTKGRVCFICEDDAHTVNAQPSRFDHSSPQTRSALSGIAVISSTRSTREACTGSHVDIHLPSRHRLRRREFMVRVERGAGLPRHRTSHPPRHTPSRSPSLSITCPDGYFCGDRLNVSANPDVVLAGLKAWQGVTSGGPVATWVEDVCVAGTYCPPNGTDMLDCPAGSWCPFGAPRPLPCDGLSVCRVNAGFQVRQHRCAGALTTLQVGRAASMHACAWRHSTALASLPPPQVNFIVPILALVLSIAIVAASCALTRTQQRAAARCRAGTGAAASIAVAAVGRRRGAAPPPLTAAPASTAALDFTFAGLTLTLPGGRRLLDGASGRCPAACVPCAVARGAPRDCELRCKSCFPRPPPSHLLTPPAAP